MPKNGIPRWRVIRVRFLQIEEEAEIAADSKEEAKKRATDENLDHYDWNELDKYEEDLKVTLVEPA